MTKSIELWDGWFFDGQYIHDQAGNKWSREGLYAAFMGEQLNRELVGTSTKISSLKGELQKRVAALAPPEIVLNWNDQEIKINFK